VFTKDRKQQETITTVKRNLNDKLQESNGETSLENAWIELRTLTSPPYVLRKPTFNHFHVIRPESYRIRWNYAEVTGITPFKVIQGHRFLYQSKAHTRFLLVINCNFSPILHRFRDIALERSKIAIFGYPSSV